MPANRAILADITANRLKHTKAHRNLGKTGRLVNPNLNEINFVGYSQESVEEEIIAPAITEVEQPVKAVVVAELPLVSEIEQPIAALEIQAEPEAPAEPIIEETVVEPVVIEPIDAEKKTKKGRGKKSDATLAE